MAQSLQGSILGARIRARRKELRITQAELARRVGISPSYLNLIERNKRGIAGRLLTEIAGEIGIRRDELDGEAEKRLAAELAEIATDPRLASLSLSAADTGDLIGRLPGWARALGVLARSERELTAMVRALNDRLTHDPFLGEAVHRMLTHISALRAAAEILRDVPDIAPEDRARFVGILAEESGRLSEVGTALAGFFDRAHEAREAITPEDEVETLFERRANHFAEIEAALSKSNGHADRMVASTIDTVLQAETGLHSDAARAHARQRLTRYAEDAIEAPLTQLLAAGAETAWDAEIMADRLHCGIDVVFRRFACLPPAEPGEKRPRFGYVETNAAGVVTQFLGLPGLAPPRFGIPCPLWIQFRASSQPGQILRQRASFPTGLEFILIARGRTTKAPGFGATVLPVTDLVALDPKDAGLTVYGRDAASLPPEPVGQSCRICPRVDCAHRVAATLVG
ncbi:MAG: short-chain fatty acyl-CoA regulator family protein [Pseudomonadota bacterium]